jgi:hypothetical protein
MIDFAHLVPFPELPWFRETGTPIGLPNLM